MQQHMLFFLSSLMGTQGDPGIFLHLLMDQAPFHVASVVSQALGVFVFFFLYQITSTSLLSQASSFSLTRKKRPDVTVISLFSAHRPTANISSKM